MAEFPTSFCPLKTLCGILILAFLSLRLEAADVTATLQSGGNWDDPAIWSTAEFPNNGNGGLTYDVVFDNSAPFSPKLTLPAGLDITIESFTYAATTSNWITIGGSLTLNAPSTSSNGWWIGESGSTIGGTGPLTFSDFHFMSGPITNTGHMIWASGEMRGFNGSFTNQGLFDFQGDGLSFWNSVSLQNSVGGTLRRSTGTGVAEINVGLQNVGTVDVDSGTLLLSGGGQSAGTFDISAGSTLETRGNFTLNEGAQIVGDGTLRHSLASTFNRTLFVNTDLVVPNLELVSGTIDSSGGALQIANIFNWNGGTTLSGNNKLLPSASAVHTGGSLTSVTGQFLNQGSLTWQGGRILLENNATFTNEGTVDLQGNTSTTTASIDGMTNTIINAASGVIRRSSGTGVHVLGLDHNDGLIDIDTGSFTIGLNDGFRNAGVVDLADGVTFYTYGMVMEQGAQVIGGGFYTLDVQQLTLEGDAFIENMTMTRGEGRIQGNGHALTVDNLEWTSGTIANVVIGTGSLITTMPPISSSRPTVQGSVTNQGTIVFGEAGILQNRTDFHTNALLTNEHIIEFHNASLGDVPFIFNQTNRLLNQPNGQVLQTQVGGDSTIGIFLENHGLVEVQQGVLRLNKVVASSSGTFRANAGTSLVAGLDADHLLDGIWEAAGGTIYFTGGIDEVNAGVTMRASGPGAAIRGPGPSNSVIQWNLGLIELDDGASMVMLANNTSVPGFVGNPVVAINDGEIFVGDNAQIDASSTGALYNRSLLRGTGTATRVYSAGELRGEPVLNVGALTNVGDSTIVGQVNTNTTLLRAGTLTIPSGSTLSVAAPVGVQFDEQTADAHLVVDGTIQGDVSDVQNLSAGTISGTGTISGDLSARATMSSTGTLNVQGDLFARGTLASGTLDVGGSTTVAGQFTIEDGAQLTGPGDINVSSTGSLSVNNILARNVVVTDGHIGGSGTVDGNVSVHDGTMSGDNQFNISGNLAITGNSGITGGVVRGSGTTTVNGILHIATDAAFGGPGAINVVSTSTLTVNGSTTKDINVISSLVRGQGEISGNVSLDNAMLQSGDSQTLLIDGDLLVTGESTVGAACSPDNLGCFGSNHVEVTGVSRILSGQQLVIEFDTTFFGPGQIEPDALSTFLVKGINLKGLNLGSGNFNIGGNIGNLISKIGTNINISIPKIDFEIPGVNIPKISIPQLDIDGDLGIESEDEVGEAAPSNIQVGMANISGTGSLVINTSSDASIGDLHIDGQVAANPGGGKLNVPRISGTGNLAIALEGATFNPGASPGRLTFTNPANDAVSIALTSGEIGTDPTFTFEINDATGQIGANPGWDALMIEQGGLTFDDSNGNAFKIDVLSLGLDNEDGAPVNFDSQQSYTWRFIDTATGFYGTPLEQIQFIIDDTHFALQNGLLTGGFSVVQDSPTSLALQYLFPGFAPLPGDHNGDGFVNAADFVLWRDSKSDDMGGYEEWRANFGNSVGSNGMGSAVPEPGTLALLMGPFVLWGCVARLRGFV